MDSLLIIIRPTWRAARSQLLSLLALAGASLALAASTTDRTTIIGVVLISGVMMCGLAWFYRTWLKQYAPLGIVATPEYLAMLWPGARRTYVPWASVAAANHATTLGGMRWYLHAASGPVTLRDIGVSAARWGVFWWAVGQGVAQRGAPVRVDSISNALFG